MFILGDGYPKLLKYASLPMNSSSIWLFRGKRIGASFPFVSSLEKFRRLFAGNRNSAMLFLNLFWSYCGCGVNESGYKLINGFLMSIDPTSTRIVFAFWIHSAGVRIHFSFKIAPEQCEGSALGGSERYLMKRDACHGKAPRYASFPFVIRGSTLYATFGAILNWKRQFYFEKHITQELSYHNVWIYCID